MIWTMGKLISLARPVGPSDQRETVILDLVACLQYVAQLL